VTALQGFHHVKLPVSDLAASREWYERVLGLRVVTEFVEDGTVRGVALSDAGGTVGLALRQDPERAAALAGFDPVAIGVPTAADVVAWRRRLDELGVPHGGVVSGHFGASLLVGLHDPDGLEIRLYALDGPAPQAR
jgi:catechol 2,3-dioxygenase-like lactoylglutathione lyase family enzyme